MKAAIENKEKRSYQLMSLMAFKRMSACLLASRTM